MHCACAGRGAHAPFGAVGRVGRGARCALSAQRQAAVSTELPSASGRAAQKEVDRDGKDATNWIAGICVKKKKKKSLARLSVIPRGREENCSAAEAELQTHPAEKAASETRQHRPPCQHVQLPAAAAAPHRPRHGRRRLHPPPPPPPRRPAAAALGRKPLAASRRHQHSCCLKMRCLSHEEEVLK